MRLVAILAAAIAGLAFWRRKKLRSDAEKVTTAAKSATTAATDRLTHGPARKALLVELGEAVLSDSGDDEVARIVAELEQLDAPADDDGEADDTAAEPTDTDE